MFHSLSRFPIIIITFYGEAELISIEDFEIPKIFAKKRVLRLILKQIQQGEQENMIFIRIKPNNKVQCHGLGFNVFKLRKGHTKGGYSVTIPQHRLF